MIKDYYLAEKELSKNSLLSPSVVLVSGADPLLGEILLKEFRTHLAKDLGQYEYISYSGETGDLELFYKELSHNSLFTQKRLLVLHQAEQLFKELFQKRESYLQIFKSTLEKIPKGTFLFVIYSGDPSKKIVNFLSSKNFSHYHFSKLYENQIPRVIQDYAKKFHLLLSLDAKYLIARAVQPYRGNIQMLLARVELSKKHKRKNPRELLSVEKEAIEELLFPSSGWDPFLFVDLLFARDYHPFMHQLLRFHPPEDSFFMIFSLMLKRANEIRIAKTAFSISMSDNELLKYFKYEKRHPFIKNKILDRLKREINMYSTSDLEHLYKILLNLHRDFRYSVPLSKQSIVFQKKVASIFW